jgi:curved DNA-binding protein CbpA
MMKDYYKILGLEEEASGEKIRARWMELIKFYDSDRSDRGRTKEEDERVREINEAYEILGNKSTRLEFDITSAIKKAHNSREKRVNIRKIILPAGILVLFLIVGLVSLRLFHVASSPKSRVLYEADKVLEKKTVSQIPPVKTNSKIQLDMKAPKEIKKEGMPRESKEIVSISPERSPSGVESKSKKKEEPAREIPPKSEVPVKVEEEVLAKEEPKPVKGLVPQVAMKSEIPAMKEVSKEVPREVPKEIRKEVTGATLHPGEKLVIKTEEGKRIANEEEVRQFFSSYIDQYHRKDIDGFLSFFSSRAVQNQKDGLKGIKNIYTKFFDESLQLRYRVEGIKIEIYENAVEVRARFRVDQTLKRKGEEKVWTGTIHWVLVKEDGALKIISLNYQNQKSP